MSSIMRRFLLALIFFALATAPFTLGNGAAHAGTVGSYMGSYSDLSHLDCVELECAEMGASVCCGAVAGHCASGIVQSDATSTRCSVPRLANAVGLDDHWRKGLGPEAETPPPRA